MDFTQEQFDEFMLYLRPAMQAAGFSDNDFAKVRDELAPKPQFAEGQVVHHSYLEFDVPTGDYFVVGLDIDADASQTRALTQTEVGPDWVPLSDVLPLMEAVTQIRSEDAGVVVDLKSLWAALDALTHYS